VVSFIRRDGLHGDGVQWPGVKFRDRAADRHSEPE
jgi:hypothetical protein